MGIGRTNAGIGKKYVGKQIANVKSYAAGLRVRNLFDNSDWSNPIAQAGLAGEHGNKTYIVDRWQAEGYLTSVAQKSNGISFSTSGFMYVYQKVERVGGKTLTFAYKTSKTTQTQLAVYDDTLSNQIIVESVTPVDGIGLITVNVPAENDTAAFIIYPENEEIIEWLALYEGEYTAETLPPYVPKGYAAELAECQRYAYSVPGKSTISWIGYVFNNTTARITIQTGSPLRMVPSVTIKDISNFDIYTVNGVISGNKIESAQVLELDGESVSIIMVSDFSGKVNSPICIRFNTSVFLSADL